MSYQENPAKHPFQSPKRTLSMDIPDSHTDESNHTESPTKNLSGAVLLFGTQPEKHKRNSKIPFVMTNWKNTPLPPEEERLINVMLDTE